MHSEFSKYMYMYCKSPPHNSHWLTPSYNFPAGTNQIVQSNLLLLGHILLLARQILYKNDKAKLCNDSWKFYGYIVLQIIY